MTSSPLLKRVAESTVIFAPMFQFGCFSASRAVTRASASFENARKGPPLAVRISFSKGVSYEQPSACQIAECSESTGRICAPVRFASAVTSAPPATRLSLLASATVFPRSTAASTPFSPANPTTAASRTSYSAAAQAVRASSPQTYSVPAGSSLRKDSVPSERAANAGRNARAIAANAADSRRAAIAVRRNRSG